MDPTDQYHGASDANATGSGPETPLEQWPRCPECQAARLTHCPICRTVGQDFVQVDPRYAIPPQKAPSTEETVRAMMVLCPTCDEPFVPTFPDQCPWCGHRFPNGYAVDELDEDAEEAASRTTAVLLGLLAWLLAFLLYLALRS